MSKSMNSQRLQLVRGYLLLRPVAALSIVIPGILLVFGGMELMISAPARYWYATGYILLAWLGGGVLLLLFLETRIKERVVLRDESVWRAVSVELGEILWSARDQGAGINRVVDKLGDSPAVQHLLQRLELPKDEVLTVLLQRVGDESVEAVIEAAEDLWQEQPLGLVGAEHFMATLLSHSVLRSWLQEHDLHVRDVLAAAVWVVKMRVTERDRSSWWRRDRLRSVAGIGLNWAAGFTHLTNQFARLPSGQLWDQFIEGRQQYVRQLVTTLARSGQANAVLVGDPGVGRFGVVRELARQVAMQVAHPALVGQRVLYIHIGEILAVGQNPALQVAYLARVLREMEQAGNVIAVLDGLGSVLGGTMEGIQAEEVLLPFFASGKVRVVAVTSTTDWHARLRANDEVRRLFEVVQMESIDSETARRVVLAAIPAIEATHQVFVPYRVVRELIQHTRGVLQDVPFPERAFDALEEIIILAVRAKQRQLKVEMVYEFLSAKVGVPLGAVGEKERQTLLSLDELMGRRLINQRRAVQAVSRALVRARSGVKSTIRPIGSFLFLGPTGVGKTQAAKALAEAYFGSPERLSRLDMSEFRGKDSVSRLIGAPAGQTGRLVSLLLTSPFTVLLLDEFEKAHASVHQLFLQVLDEGYLHDVQGRQISFEHVIIIATSNAGAEFIRSAVDSNGLREDFDDQLRDHILRRGVFRPELLNRFDDMVVFEPLSRDHLRAVAHLLLKDVNEQLETDRGITVVVTDELVEFLVEHGYDPQFGARPMRRLIQDTVEYFIGRLLLTQAVAPGRRVEIPLSVLRELVR